MLNPIAYKLTRLIAYTFFCKRKVAQHLRWLVAQKHNIHGVSACQLVLY